MWGQEILSIEAQNLTFKHMPWSTSYPNLCVSSIIPRRIQIVVTSELAKLSGAELRLIVEAYSEVAGAKVRKGASCLPPKSTH